MLKSYSVLRSLYWDLCIRTQDNRFATAISDKLTGYVFGFEPYTLDGWLAFAGDLAKEVRNEGHGLTGQDASNLLFLLDTFKKVPGSKRSDEVLLNFLSVQSRVGEVHLRRDWDPKLKRICKFWLGAPPDSLFDEVRHGPGATAEKVVWDDKYFYLRSRPKRLEQVWKLIDPLDRLSRKVESDVPSRVLVVEKDRKGGRIIAAEQTSLQFVQQGIGRAMTARLQRNAGLQCLVDREKHIQFLKDRIHERSTVDLKSASDFVSMKLAASILPKEWMRLIACARSPRFSISGKVYTTKTVALMGNGFCFSTLSLVCAALCALTTGDWVAGKTWSVFGDDIVIDNRFLSTLRYVLECVGLVVNHDKTFTPEHPFAETCGTDIWRSDLTNVRPKFLRSSVDVPVTVNDLPKLCEYQRYLVTRGCKETASAMKKSIDKIGTQLVGFPSYTIPFFSASTILYATMSNDNDSDALARAHWSRRYQSYSVLDLSKSDTLRKTSLDAGESFSKYFHHGTIVEEETLSRNGSWKLKRKPLLIS